MNHNKYVLALVLAFAMSIFAQEAPEKTEPEKIAVYVSGASEAGINKSLGSKLLAAIAQSGKYAEIANSEAFHEELAKSQVAASSGQIVQETAKQHGADIVCAVSMTEALGAYSISARMIKISDSEVIKTASLDRALKSLDDLTMVSNELAAKLLGLAPPPVAVAPPTVEPAPVPTPVPAPVVKSEDKRKLLSPGFRGGLNLSYLDVEYYNQSNESLDGGTYNSTLGFQAGLVLDIAISDLFHVQPGVMYIQKGAKDDDNVAMTLHNIEIPLLLSFKLSALRLNAGPYFGICLDSNMEYGCDFVSDFDIGISTGFGFDIIDMFYIGVFYDYSLIENERGLGSYSNRTLGLNFGVNL